MKKKIKNSVARRFKVTKTGKVLFAHQYNSHHKNVKSKRTNRRHNVPGVLPEMFGKKVKKAFGIPLKGKSLKCKIKSKGTSIFNFSLFIFNFPERNI